MDIQQAKQLFAHVSELAEVSARYRARYGGYQLHANRDEDAHRLHDEALSAQTTIARQLDRDALLQPARGASWWRECDILPLYVANELAYESMRLIALFGYTAGDTVPPAAHTRSLQQNIAGRLHPTARQRVIQASA